MFNTVRRSSSGPVKGVMGSIKNSPVLGLGVADPDAPPAPATPTVPGGPIQPPASYPADQSADISTHLARMTSSNSPVMKQARTSGLQQANQRGLLNSSMGIQAAEDAAYRVALPAASQMVSQGHATQIADKNIAAHDREKSMAAAMAGQGIYGQMFSSIASNAQLPADVRESYLSHIGKMLDTSHSLVEQFYGIKLNWK